MFVFGYLHGLFRASNVLGSQLQWATARVKGSEMAKSQKADPKKVSAMTKKVATARSRSAKVRTKQIYDDKGAQVLLSAVAVAMAMPKMPNDIENAEMQRVWCIANNAPSVQRNVVCRKATNYRADNALRARIASLQVNGIIPEMITVVWAVNNAMAKANPFSVDSEKVFIVRK